MSVQTDTYVTQATVSTCCGPSGHLCHQGVGLASELQLEQGLALEFKRYLENPFEVASFLNWLLD